MQDTKSTEKSVAFFISNNKIGGKKIKISAPFTVATKVGGNSPKNKFNQGNELPLQWKLQNTERNWRGCKEMERYPIFMDLKN